MAEEEKLEFKVGGFCRLKAEAVAKVQSATVRLLKAGWPNHFAIDQIYEDEKQGMLLRLDPCCGWMLDPDDPEKHSCEAHPARYFEPLPGHLKDQLEVSEGEEEEEGQEGPEGAQSGKGPEGAPSGGRYAGFAMGEGDEDIISVEYTNGGKAPSFIVRKSGKAPQVLRGTLAVKALRAFTKLGIL